MMSSSKFNQYIVFTTLGLLAYVLNITASVDWSAYVKIVNRLMAKPWSQVLADFSFFQEPLFYLNAKLWGEIVGFSVFILVLTIIFINVKLHFLQKLSSRPWLVVYLYVCSYLFLFEGTVLRVAYATALIIPALYFLTREQWWRSLLLWFLATQIHFSAAVFLLAAPLIFLPYVGLRWLFLLFVLSPLCIVFQLSLFELLMNIVGWFREDYATYGRKKLVEGQNSSGMFFYYVFFYYLLILSSVIALRERLKESASLRMIAGLCMLAVITMCALYDHVVVAARLGELLLVVSPILVAQAVNDWPYWGKRFITIAIMSGFALIGVARFVYLYPELIRF